MAETQFGPVATRVLLENEAVKVWEMDLAPGEACATHRHTMEYVLYILSGADLLIEGPNYKPYPFPAPTRATYFVPPGAVESARNVGNTRFYEALFEIKRPAPAEAKSPGFTICEALVNAEPQPGVVSILENDRVRVRETTLAPGQETGMHYQSRDAAVYVIEGGRLRHIERATETGPEQASEAAVADGAVAWLTRGVYRNAINLGNSRYRQVSVELK
jgi:quercetin dioxygenase-like cupin family protein